MTPEKFKQLIQIAAGTYDIDLIGLEVAIVTEVDTTNWLCTVQTQSGVSAAIYSNVQLTAAPGSNGFIKVPSIGSTVIVATTIRNETYLKMTSEVDQLIYYRDNGDGTFTQWTINEDGMQYNDGSYGGLVRYDNLITLLTATNKILAALLRIINAAPIPEPGNGNPSALQAAFRGALSGLNIGSLQELASSFATHGKPTQP